MKHFFQAMICATVVAGARAAVPAEEALLKTALDPNGEVVERTRAFSELGGVAGERSLAALAPLLGDPTWGQAARSVFETTPGAAAERVLLRALETVRDDKARVGLVNSLGNRRAEGAVAAIAKLLASPNLVLADAALNALGNIGNAPAADALLGFKPATELRAAWADAALRAADSLAPTARAKSAALFGAVKKQGPAPQAAAAWIGGARLSANPATAIVAALRSDDESARTSALAVIRAGEFGPALTAAVGEACPALSAGVQVQTLAVLYDRGDRAAATIARRALGSGDPAVAAAAAKLLSVVGMPDDAPALLRMMVGEAEPAPSARLALARIPGSETAALLVAAFRAGGVARPAALEVLLARGHRALLPELLRPELLADEAFRPAVANAIQVLATGADLGRVLELHRALPVDSRGVIETALRRIAAKDPSPDAAAVAVEAAARKLPLAEAGALYTILAAVGGEAALNSLLGLLQSDSIDARKMALRALGNWREAQPAAKLLEVARADSDAGVRALAIRSAASLFTRSAFGTNNAPAPDQVAAAIAGLRQAWSAAEQPEERDVVIAALKSLKHEKATAAAEELEKTPARRE